METQHGHPLTRKDVDTLEGMLDANATFDDTVAARELALEVTGSEATKSNRIRTITVINENGEEEEMPVSHIGHHEQVGPRLAKGALNNAIAVDSESWHLPKN